MSGKIDGLTAKQAVFVQEYLIDLNATKAAIRAGYSAKTADKIGTQLLGKTGVSKAVAQAMEARGKRLGRQADDVLVDIYTVGRQAREQGQFGQALKALELEGKHLGLFVPKQEEQEPVTISVTFKE